MGNASGFDPGFASDQRKGTGLVQAIRLMFSPIRNRARLVGNLCTSSPAAETVPALVVLDAPVKMESARGERIIPLSEFFPGSHQTARRPDEILTEVILPVQEGSLAFFKLGRRKVEERGKKRHSFGDRFGLMRYA